MYKKFIKRILDIIFSFLFLIILLPIFLLVAILILIIDKNKIIFKQIRTGKNGKDFYIYKFSSFKNGSITKLGRVLRTISIDELPQLINILKGDMSFIGPRPWVKNYYENMNDIQKNRVNVLPGLTGLAQVMGRNDISIFDKINYDLEYVNNISFLLDLKIIFKTIKVIIYKEEENTSEINIENEILELEKVNKVSK